MKVSLRDLTNMSRKERYRLADEITRKATAHRDRESRFVHLLHALRWFVMGRVPR